MDIPLLEAPMSDLTKKEQAFLDEMTNYIHENIPDKTFLSCSKNLMENVKSQLLSVVKHDMDGFFAWNSSWGVNASICISPKGSVSYNWGSTERSLTRAIAAISLYQKIVAFGSQLEAFLTEKMVNLKTEDSIS